jgi:hypothetical protein
MEFGDGKFGDRALIPGDAKLKGIRALSPNS